MSETATAPVVSRGPGNPSWKPDPVTGLIRGKYTPDQWTKMIEEGKRRKRAERLAEENSKVQEVEVTRGPSGVRVKFIGRWDAQEKASLLSELILKSK